MMPLALLGVGESGTITDIRGKEDVVHHLHNLGFAAGTDVEVVGNTDAGMTGKQAGHIITMMYPAQAERMGCKQHTEVQHSFLYGTTQPPPFSPFQYIRLRVLAHQISPSVKNQQDCSPALFRQIIRSLQNQMHRPFTGEMYFSVHPPILHGIVCHPRSDKRHCCYFRYIHNFRQFVFSIFIFLPTSIVSAAVI